MKLITSLLAALLAVAAPVGADTPAPAPGSVIPAAATPATQAAAVPGPAFDGDRYTDLWTKSPFAIATPDAPTTTEDYDLVGLAQFDGVSYVSLVERGEGGHFAVSSDKPFVDAKRGLNIKLVSITRGPGAASAVIERNGVSLTLHQTAAALAPPTAATPTFAIPGMPNQPANGIVVPQPAFMPSPNPSVGGMVPASDIEPRARFHRRFIRIPPPPSQ